MVHVIGEPGRIPGIHKYMLHIKEWCSQNRDRSDDRGPLHTPRKSARRYAGSHCPQEAIPKRLGAVHADGLRDHAAVPLPVERLRRQRQPVFPSPVVVVVVVVRMPVLLWDCRHWGVAHKAHKLRAPPRRHSA